ncbi:MAG: CsgG/HfaB family protein [Gemmatimonadaceae bacterium]
MSGAAFAQDKQELQKCEKPIGTLAVVEPQNEYMVALQRYQLGSPTGLIRMMVQQSKCFVVLERGQAMNNMKQERDLAKNGEMQQDENMGAGMMKAADFILTPAVVIASGNSGGVGGAVGGLLGRKNPVVAAVAGGAKFKEAQTSMLIADARTTVQVAAAEGKAKKTDFSLGALGFVGGAITGVGGYTNTPEGKIIAASYLDNYNNIVTSIKADPDLMARADKFKTAGLSGADVKAGATFPEGAVLAPRSTTSSSWPSPRTPPRSSAC